MSELRIYPYACNGLKSCGRCEELMPGFITECKGRKTFSPEQERESAVLIEGMLEECPSSALSFDGGS